MSKTIHVGFEVDTARAVEIPRLHLAVTGQTQESGKTTTLEGLISRAGLRAVAFVTKRGEGSFRTGRVTLPYFRERTDWRFVQAILEASEHERMKFQRSWIMKLCESHNGRDGKWKRPTSLRQVLENVETALEKARGLSESVYTELREYLKTVIPQIERLPFAARLNLKPGLNVVELEGFTPEVQALVIGSTLEWVYQNEENTVVVVPEAWKFIPRDRGSPVKLQAETYIREALGLGNLFWIDSQDLAGVHTAILKQIGVWLIGVQRERNEVKRMLDHIPITPQIKPAQIMMLDRGQFFVCYRKTVTLSYVQPAWLGATHAQAIARGEESPESVEPILRAWVRQHRNRAGAAPNPGAELENRAEHPPDSSGAPTPATPPSRGGGALPGESEEAVCEKHKELERQVTALQKENETLQARIAELERRGGARLPTKADAHLPGNGAVDAEAVRAIVREMAGKDPGILALVSSRPELRVTVERPVLEVDHKTLRGRLALLIHEGFFDEPRTGSAAFSELYERRKFKTSKPNVYRECDSLANLGFLVSVSGGYQVVPGMKVNVVES